MSKILFSLLAILLLSGCEFNLKDNEKKPVEENKITELSKESDVVKKIVNTFISHVGDYNEGIYSQEKISEIFKYQITLTNVRTSGLIKQDANCNSNKYSLDNTFSDYDYVEYLCKYITYEDFNNLYKNSFGLNLPKEIIYGLDEGILVYNSSLDVYEFVDVGGPGGGYDERYKLSDIIKVEQDNNNIYIYENVIYVVNVYGDPELVEQLAIIFPHLSNNIEIDVGPKYAGDKLKTFKEIKEELLTKYLSKFDTYKWTFKKNSNGTYMYESLEYVEQ